MWFKNFFMNSIDALFNAIGTLGGGGYEGDAFGLIGLPLLYIFFIGCVKILSVVIDFCSTYWGRLKQRLKQRRKRR